MVRLSCAFATTVFISLITCFAGESLGQIRTKPVECSGVVVDGQGNPVAGAEVICAESLYDYAAGRTTWGPPARATTGADGKFRVQAEAERRDYLWVVAWKKGLSIGWLGLRGTPSNEDVTINLPEPAILAGVVVDEDGHPIAGATLRPCLKMESMGGSVGVRFDEPREYLLARTDAEGRFRFDSIPPAASADFFAEAPGFASCWTYWEDDLSDLSGSRFKAGRTDIRIVLKPEAIVRGRVIDENSGQGVASVEVLARPDTGYANYSCVEPVTSGPDGAFVYRGLVANDYSFQIVAPQRRAADWTGKDVKVTAVAGQAVDVNIPVGKGGIVEVVALDAATGKPIKNARATVSQKSEFSRHTCWYYSSYADADGLIRLRAPAGECRLTTWADAYQYLTDPEPPVAVKGQVLRREVRLDAYPVVTGIVRDPNGQPAAGVTVSSKPVCEEPANTDEQGRFRVTWRPSQSIRNVMLLAQDRQHNLAGLAPVADQSQPVDVTLAPAFTIRGRVIDSNGKAVPMAAVALKASMPGWRTNVAPEILTDANGVYETHAIPAQCEDFKYRLEVNTSGYGPAELRTLPFDVAQDRQVNVETIVLPVADRSISGVVVDANGTPAPGQPIFITGPRGSDTAGQPRIRTVSDEQGRFASDGVCAGPLRIQAGWGGSNSKPGFLDAEGGDSDVKVVLGREGVHLEIKSLLGKPLPDTKALLDLPPEQTQDKPILLCFFDMQQRPSRRCVDSLAKQVDALKSKGVILAVIQIATVDDETWKAWAAERGESLALGRIREDLEKAKSAWGVQSLPWLILTDDKHVVRAEGFSMNELDERIKQMRGE